MKKEFQTPEENCVDNKKVYYLANQNFVTREIAGELLLVPVKEQTQKLNGMITFSEAGALLWKKLQKPCTQDDLVECLAKEYDKHPEEVKDDVTQFIENAIAKELVMMC